MSQETVSMVVCDDQSFDGMEGLKNEYLIDRVDHKTDRAAGRSFSNIAVRQASAVPRQLKERLPHVRCIG